MADDVLFNLDGDATSAVDALQQILDMLTNVSDALTTVADAFTSLDASSATLANLTQAQDDAAASSTTLSDATQQVADTFTTLEDISGAVQLSFDDLDSTFSALDAVLPSIVDSTTSLSDALATLPDISDATTVSLADMATVIADTTTSTMDSTAALVDNTIALNNVAGAAAAAAAGFATVSGAQTQSAVLTQQGTTTQTENTAATEDAAAAQNDFGQSANESAMAALMLAPILIKATTSFISMGTGALDAMAHVTGLADPTLLLAKNSGVLSNLLSQLGTQATTYGVNMKDAANGLYYIISAGYSANDAMLVLHNSMEAAAATGTQMDTVSNALTSVLHAYNLNASDASNITNQMIQTVVDGKQQFSEFATTIGRTAAAGAQAGISFDQVAAAEATLTQINPSVQHDTQNLSHLFIKLSTDTAGMEKRAKALGEQFNLTSFRSMDLYDKLQYISGITKGNSDNFKKVIGDATSYSVALDLLSNHGASYKKILGDINNSSQALATAFSTSSQTITFAMQRVGAVLSLISMKLVTVISPFVSEMFSRLASIFNDLASNTDLLMPLLGAVAGIISGVLFAAIAGLMVMFGPILLQMSLLGVVFGGLGAAIVVLIPYIQKMIDSSDPLLAMLLQLKSVTAGAAEEFSLVFHAAMQVIGPIVESVSKSIIQQLVPAFISLATRGMQAATIFANGLESAIYALQPLLNAIGQIISSVVVPAFIAFANGLGSTLFGMLTKLGNFLQNISPTLQSFGNYVEKNVVPALQKMGPVINAVATTLGRLSPLLLTLGGGLLLIIPRFGMITGIIGSVVEGFAGIGEAVSNFMPIVMGGANVMRVLGGGIAQVAKLLINPVRMFQVFGSAIVGAWQVVSGFVMTLIGPLVGAFQTVVDFFGTFAAVSASGMGPLMTFQIMIGPIIADLGSLVAAGLAAAAPFIALGAAVAAIVAGLVLFFTQTKTGIGLLGMIGQQIRGLWSIIVSALQPAFQQVGAEMQRLQPLLGQLGQLFNMLAPVLGLIGAIVGGVLVVALGLLIAAIAGIAGALGKVIQGLIMVVSGVIQIFTGLAQTLGGIMALIYDIFHANWGKIGTDMKMIGTGIANMWFGLWHAVQGVVTGTVGAVIAFIGGFVTAIINFFTHMWSVIVGHSIWPDMWKGISKTAVQFIAVVLATFVQFVATLITAFTKLATTVVALFVNFGKKLISAASNAASMIYNLLAGTFMRIQNIILSCVTMVMLAVSTAFMLIGNIIMNTTMAIGAIIQMTWNMIWSIISYAAAGLMQIVQTAWKGIQQVITTVQQAISALLAGDWGKFFTLIAKACDQMNTVVSKFWASILKLFVDTGEKLVKALQSAWDAILKAVKDAVTKIINIISDFIKNFLQAIEKGAKDIWDQFTQMCAGIAKIFLDLVQSAEEWGKHLIEGLAKGITGAIGTITGAVGNVVQAISSVLHFSTPKKGPLSTYKTWMPHMVQGLSSTLHASTHHITTAAAVTAQRVADAIKLKTEKAHAAAAAATLRADLKAEKAAAAAAKKIESAALAKAHAATAAARTSATHASNSVGTSSSSGGIDYSTEVVNLLQQILDAITSQGSGGGGGGASIGYAIPSTQLGSLTQQFGSSGRLTPNDIAGLYQQLNQLGGLSTEYASRGASSGVGF